MKRVYSRVCARPLRGARLYDPDLMPDGLPPGGITVIVDDDLEWADTGLVSAEGEKITVRIREARAPCGYIWHDEDGELRPRTFFE